MGQAQSNNNNLPDADPLPPTSVAVHQTTEPSTAVASASASASAADSSPSSMDSLLAEAAAYGDDDENASLDVKAQRALDCPCLANLRKGPCGSQFSESFLCFLKSTAEEKGSDCVTPFVALQTCIKSNPDAFPKDVLEDEEVKKEEKPTPQYRILPPKWALDSGSPRQKL